jgi:hypothetical protein
MTWRIYCDQQLLLLLSGTKYCLLYLSISIKFKVMIENTGESYIFFSKLIQETSIKCGTEGLY